MLRHSNDDEPGITRRRADRGWAYFAPGGKRVADRAEIDRLNSIGLPPAYTDAWFCTDPQGHIQATGRDRRGRKQYRYHPDYRARRDSQKFAGCLEFGRALPRLRRRVEADLRRRSLGRETVLAAVVRLLDAHYIRVGNARYARANHSYGATTLRSRHVRRAGQRLTMRFAGKHGVVHEVELGDPGLKRVVRRCHELPGQNLFQFVGADGKPHPVSSADVNAYIREASGGDFTAKHFRTFGASAIAFEQLLAKEEERRISVSSLVEPVAEALGNTVAMSRKSYVHPALIEAVKQRPRDPLRGMERPRPRKRLSSAETGLIAFLARSGRRRRAGA